MFTSQCVTYKLSCFTRTPHQCFTFNPGTVRGLVGEGVDDLVDFGVES